MSTGSRPKTMALSSPSPSPPPAASTGFNLLGGFLMETLDDFLRGTFHLLVESFHSDLLSGSAAGSLSLRLLRLRFGLWQGKGYRLSSEAVKER